jgi:PhnB protein
MRISVSADELTGTAGTVAAGATQVRAVADEHGWQLGRIEDPYGHYWEIGRPLGYWPPPRR